MENFDKIETKRETTYNANGEIISETVTYEKSETKKFNYKDLLDAVIKLIGIAAIFFPIWLFYLQKNSEYEREKAIIEFDSYSNLSIELHRFINLVKFYNVDKDNEIEIAKDTLLFNLIPKSSLFKDDSIGKYLGLFKNDVGLLYFYYKLKIFRANFYEKLISDADPKRWPKNIDSSKLASEYNGIIDNDLQYLNSSYLSNLIGKRIDLDSLRQNFNNKDSALFDNLYDFLRIRINDPKHFSMKGHLTVTFLDINKIDEIDDRIIGREKERFEEIINNFDSLVIKTNKLIN
jgi:hypothetical protein